jgi:hypothetical protein
MSQVRIAYDDADDLWCVTGSHTDGRCHAAWTVSSLSMMSRWVEVAGWADERMLKQLLKCIEVNSEGQCVELRIAITPISEKKMLSKTAEYALRAVTSLAANGEYALPSDVLAEKTKVPRRYLTRVMQDLTAFSCDSLANQRPS